tara:strand:+ start:72 stop:275 length:204 start_codon:yes stop_codon:yes gene_type:complete
MEEIVDLIATDASPSEVSDKVKDLLFAKSAAKLDAMKPSVANSFFGDQAPENTYVAGEEPIEQENEE